MSGTNAWKLLGTENTLTVSTLDLSGTTGLEFGTGENSLTASLAKGTITDKGKGTHTIKTMDGATLNAEDSTAGTSVSITGSAKGATFKMGTGANEINAVGKVLDSVTITDKAVGASTNVMAGSLIGTSVITLKGNTTVGSSVNVSGSIKGATIDTGAGIGTVTAGSVADSNIKMDMGGADATRIQTFIVKGNVSNTNLDTGAGNDYVSIGGTVTGGTFKLDKGDDDVILGNTASGATFDLGEGTNSLTGKTLSNVNVTASGLTATDATTITAGAYKTGAAANNITLGNGANTINLNSISGASKLDIIMGAATGTEDQTLTVKGAVTNASVKTGAGTDTITVNGAVSKSDFDLGKGTNSFTAMKTVKGKDVYQTLSDVNIDASGDDSVVDTDVTTIKAGAYKMGATGNHIKLGDGANNVTLNSIYGRYDANKVDIDLGAAAGIANQTLTVNGNVNNATIKSGTGADLIDIKGAILKNTDMNLAAGNNTLNVGKSSKGLTYTGGAGKDDVTITGGLSNSSLDLGAGTNSVTAMKVVKGKDVYQTLSNVNIDASGDDSVVGTDVTTIKAGAYKIGSAGNHIKLGDGANDVTLNSITGAKNYLLDITMGAAANTAIQKLTVNGNVNNTTIFTGAGNDLLTINGAVTGATTVSAFGGTDKLTVGKSAKGLSYTGTTGTDTIEVGGAVTNSTFDLGAGANSFTAMKTVKGVDVYQTLSNVNIDASGTTATDATTIKAGAYKNGATASNHIKLGAGNNDVTLNSITGAIGFNTQMTLGDPTNAFEQKLTVNGAVNRLEYTGSEGDDIIKMLGAVSNSTINMGNGANKFEALKADSTGAMRGQTLTNVDLLAGSGADTISYGKFVLGAGNNTINLGNGLDVINLVA